MTVSNDVKPPLGVYFLANDRVLHWTIACLESLRIQEPDARLVLIPFNQQVDRIVALRDRYRFEVFDPPELAALDDVGARFFPSQQVPRHTFRKFAVFWG